MTNPAQDAPAASGPAPLKVALLGGGTVGSQAARILTEDAEALRDRVGAPLELTGIAVRSLGAERDWRADPALYTTDAEALVDGADIVIELMGGTEPARTLIRRALAAGTSVITGNKALLAQHGEELFALASETGAQLSFEAAVAGAIPILRPLRDSLSGDTVTRVMGIANGTTNFILDRMDTEGADFADALAEAQRLGYAEADPTADVGGLDAAAKAAILATLSFGAPYTLDDVAVEGITAITAEDNAAAADAGYVIKLLAIAERATAEDGTSGAVLRVHPTLLPREHPLASVRGAYNAVFVEAENAGQLMFYGPGAGGAPTASAVMGDVVSIAQRIVRGGPARLRTPVAQLPALDAAEASTSCMVVLHVADEPGVLRRVAAVFEEHGVSLETLRQVQSDRAAAPGASLRLITHRARQRDLDATVDALAALDAVHEVVSVLKAEGN
ncbi:homoserine dehydrogenase [Micrococcus sp. EYE_162]|uniref:homoserine dehydrogenase n=1 Tax=unclassified Micrococcus TaxID=2620948 RepID=UPI0020030EA4|nr:MULTISPECIES: homoserine dehydrogenase [unclassified Micrococcus]MCK6094457.1 homoserine dehydrogenase [Micrococcus sp. EYE_212]MCK6170638.1 homoserine dehydrogenase [Micrococcus sp. EYE_162]